MKESEMKMDDKSSSNNNNEVTVTEEQCNFCSMIQRHRNWFWGIASAAQLGWGIRAVKRGYGGDSKFMPLKAFGVASLFVGAAATASFGALRSSGIYKVEDMKEVGANIRTSMGVPPRKQAN